MNNTPFFAKGDRLLVLAPHPDDEALATGGLLQRAVEAGVETRIIFLTDGDNNPWPQRVIERRWRVSEAKARTRWGTLRRNEARASLLVLGQGTCETEFWSLPDQGLTELLLSGGTALTGRLRDAVAAWRPTLLVAPSVYDRHPDHSAVGLAVDIVLRRLKHSSRPVPALLSYIVHGNPRLASSPLRRLILSESEVETKRCSILCHLSQILLSRKRFLAHARAEEVFLMEPTMGTSREGCGGLAVRSGLRIRESVRVDFDLSVRDRLFSSPEIHIIAESTTGELQHTCASVRYRKRIGSVLVPQSFFDEETQYVFFMMKPRFGMLYHSAGWIGLKLECEDKSMNCESREQHAQSRFDLMAETY